MRKREITTSTRDFGSAPVNEATKILVMLAPRGIITPSLIGINCSPTEEFARSKISAKKCNMELEASLQRETAKEGKQSH